MKADGEQPQTPTLAALTGKYQELLSLMAVLSASYCSNTSDLY